MSFDTLKEICLKKHDHIKERKKSISQAQIIRDAEIYHKENNTRGFLSAIESKISSKNNALIAEIKKRSPSKGILRKDFDVGQIARNYTSAGATCISVLTDTPYFAGEDVNLSISRQNSNLPLLRKDFMLDPYQIYESRILGADAVLLIMAALGDIQASELENTAISIGLDVLIEVHDEEELVRALQLKSKMIGINNRNLKTLQVDLGTTQKLAALLPKEYIIIGESGIRSYLDVQHFNKLGIYSFLVGEALIVSEDIEMATRSLLGS